jgi:hypothetical protein
VGEVSGRLARAYALTNEIVDALNLLIAQIAIGVGCKFLE